MDNTKNPIIDSGTFKFKVNKDVVAHLSVGLYRNFGRAIKELISNSYDADATEVKIKLDLKNKQIVIRDNGNGMNKIEIEEHFLHIAKRTKPSEDTSKLGRKRIGTFGIGFLGTFPYCKEFELITKKREGNEIIHVVIDTNQFFEEINREIPDIQVPFSSTSSDIPQEKGETIIVLKNIADHIIKELSEETKDFSSIEKMGGFGKFKWTLAQYAPLQFPTGREDLREFFEDPNVIPMHLFVNAEELFRNVPENAKILERDNKKIGNVQLKYAIMSPLESVKPKESKGLQIRLRNVAVGFPTDFEIIKATGKVPGKLNYLCGEVHIERGLYSALMIDRDNFSFTEEIADIHEFFRTKLNFWNDKLEDWALNDKKFYTAFLDLPNSEKIVNELKEANIIHLSKERLRISTNKPLLKSKTKKAASLSTKMFDAFSKQTEYKIIESNDSISKNKAPIKIDTEEKIVTIFKEHPDFIEKISILNETFNVQYDNWEIKNSTLPICKLTHDEKNVIFNIKHPLFNTEIDDSVIKHLSLGFIVLLKNTEKSDVLIRQFNRLLEDIFLGHKQ